MQNALETVPQNFGPLPQRFVDHFIPPAMARDPEAYNRARMFLISHFLGPFLGGTVPAALYFLAPNPGPEIAVLAGGILLFWAFPFLLKAEFDYNLLVLLSIAVDWFVVYWACYFYGGVSSPTLHWFLIIPILALFYIGGDNSLHGALLTLSAVASAIFFVVYILVEPRPHEMPDNVLSVLGALSTVAVLCYVATMAIYYARIFDAGVALEVEVRRRRQLADELRQAIVKAHRVGLAKDECLARMSHEIRTPLNAIIGYGQILHEEAIESGDEQMLEDVNRIVEAARYLVRLINMILDLAKIGAGRMSFDVRRHSLREIIADTIKARSPEIEASGNVVIMSIEEGLDDVLVDRLRLLQVVDAILENANRFTSEGRIKVSASRIAFGEAEGFAVAVSDTGCGMSAEALEALFETFATARSASDGRYGGTGLNLAVCSELCRAMGGSIAVASRPGRGSTFTIRLPLAPQVTYAGDEFPSRAAPRLGRA